jgi:putative glycosyltransferase
MQLSIVTTLYKSAPYIEEFWKRMTASAAAITDDYEIIFVNDGSPDDSLGVALKVHERDPKVKVVDLSRNFGHHKAIMTGLSAAKGELVFLIDVDLEEEPEWLQLFHKTLQDTKGCDVVYVVHISFRWVARVTDSILPMINWRIADQIAVDDITV